MLLPDHVERPEYICRSSDTDPLEYQANRFASCLLMPRDGGKRTDIQTLHLHYERGYCAYVCVIDDHKRPFDFIARRFRPIEELEKSERVCLFATGREEDRAGFGYSYTTTIDLYHLVENIPDSSVPTEGLTFSIRWLLQKGELPSPKNDFVLPHSAQIRYLNGQFSSVDISSQEIFDENISFAKRQRWEEEQNQLREQEFEKQMELSERFGKAVNSADVAATLLVLAESISCWAQGLKPHLIEHFYFDTQDPFFRHFYQIPPRAGFQIIPSWLNDSWIGMVEVYDLLEFHKSIETAKAYSKRLDGLIEARDKFVEQVVEATKRFEWRIDVESFVFLDKQRKDLRKRANDVCEYLALIATQFEASTIHSTSTKDESLSERAQVVLVGMLELNAVDSDRRKSTDVIVGKSLGTAASPNAVKAVMAELNAKQFVNSKQGRGGGIWLTEKGRDRAKKLRDQ